MRIDWPTLSISIATSIVPFAGCDDDHAATGSAQESAPTAAASSEPAPPRYEAQPRPKSIDFELTAARRTSLEAKLPEARGFLLASELEEKLKEDKSVDRNERAMERLDQEAEGRWVLFVGPILAMEGAGFSLPVKWHRGSQKDSMGVTPSWVSVGFEEVHGHSTIFVSEGAKTVVLAKYLGKGHAAPAFDVVGLGWW